MCEKKPPMPIRADEVDKPLSAEELYKRRMKKFVPTESTPGTEFIRDNFR